MSTSTHTKPPANAKQRRRLRGAASLWLGFAGRFLECLPGHRDAFAADLDRVGVELPLRASVGDLTVVWDAAQVAAKGATTLALVSHVIGFKACCVEELSHAVHHDEGV